MVNRNKNPNPDRGRIRMWSEAGRKQNQGVRLNTAGSARGDNFRVTDDGYGELVQAKSSS